MSVEDEMIPELSLKQAYKLCRLKSGGGGGDLGNGKLLGRVENSLHSIK